MRGVTAITLVLMKIQNMLRVPKGFAWRPYRQTGSHHELATIQTTLEPNRSSSRQRPNFG